MAIKIFNYFYCHTKPNRSTNLFLSSFFSIVIQNLLVSQFAMSIRIVSYDTTIQCIVIRNDTGKEKRGTFVPLPNLKPVDQPLPNLRELLHPRDRLDDKPLRLPKLAIHTLDKFQPNKKDQSLHDKGL